MSTTKKTSTPAPGSDAVGVRFGRRGTTYTDINDWVTLSAVSPTAKALYVVLRAHVNRQRGDDTVWTSTLALAVILGYSRGDKLKDYMDELVALGAIERERSGLHGRNIYVVNQEPAPGYAGPLMVKDWHDANKPRLAELREIEKAARDARRAKAKGRNRSSAPVTPDRGEQAVTPDRGEPVTPDRGEPVHPISGREQDVVEPDVLEPDELKIPPASLTSGEPPARDVVAAEGGDSEHIEERTEERGPLDRIVDELVALSPGWDAKVTREVLEALAAAGRAPADVVRVATECAQGMHGVTQSPRRLLSWWPSKPATGAAQVIEPDWARGPVTYLPADRERCRVHSSEPSGACGQCKADKVAADAGEPVTTFELPDELAALSPVEAAKAMAARAKTGRRPHRQRSPEPVDEPVGAPPAAIGSLFAEVAASVGARA